MSEISKSTKVAVDIGAGTCGGIAQLLVGHPFDTVKVALQTMPTVGAGQLPKYTSPLDAARKIVTQQGPLALYRGVSSPMAMVAAFNALLFSVTGALNRIVRPDGGQLTSAEAAFTGFLAGVPVSILATPTELLKCRLQFQGSVAIPPGYTPSKEDIRAGKVLFKGPKDALVHILKHEGGIPSLFKGLSATLARECIGNAFYFGAYAATKNAIARAQGLESTADLNAAALVAAGGIAGAAFWIPTVPVDTVKSRLQVDNHFTPKYKGMIDCFGKVYRSEGWVGLWRGWQPCIARSVPANAVTFVVYEYAKKAMLDRV